MLNLVKEHKQEQVLEFLQELDDKHKEMLIQQVQNIDFDLLQYCTGLLNSSHEVAHYVHGTLQPTEVVELPRTEVEKEKYKQAIAAGEALIAAGKAGVVLVAGGQGTRLGFDAPKGMFPVGPVTQRTLFQYHTEKIIAREKRCRAAIPFYIMTSDLNYDQTVAYFEENNYFGKDKDTFVFFKQGMLPPLSSDGKMFLSEKYQVAMAPDGHGGLLRAMKNNGIVDDMRRRGLEVVYYFQVDSPLANVCDPAFLGFHQVKGAEMSAKTVYKADPYEKLGNVGVLDGKTVVIEYTELSKEEMEAVNPNGRLKFGQGSIGIHVFSVDFLHRMNSEKIQLPYHIAHKKIPYISPDGDRFDPEKPNGFKFEQFIFDALPLAKQVLIMETDRQHDFSPIKNKDGIDSPATARRDLCNLFGQWLEAAGLPLNRDDNGNVTDRIEISPLYALDEQEFVANKPVLSGTGQSILFE